MSDQITSGVELPPNFFNDTPFLKEVKEAIEQIAQKYGVDKPDATSSILVVAAVSKEMPEGTYIKDHVTILGSGVALNGSLAKCIRNPDGVFASIISRAFFDDNLTTDIPQ